MSSIRCHHQVDRYGGNEAASIEVGRCFTAAGPQFQSRFQGDLPSELNDLDVISAM